MVEMEKEIDRELYGAMVIINFGQFLVEMSIRTITNFKWSI